MKEVYNSFPMFMIFCKSLEEATLFLWLGKVHYLRGWLSGKKGDQAMKNIHSKLMGYLIFGDPNNRKKIGPSLRICKTTSKVIWYSKMYTHCSYMCHHFKLLWPFFGNGQNYHIFCVARRLTNVLPLYICILKKCEGDWNWRRSQRVAL